MEGDGRLVPATDDEVMEVEGLLLDDKTEMHIVADTEQNVGCTSNEGSSCGMPQLESSEGLLLFQMLLCITFRIPNLKMKHNFVCLLILGNAYCILISRLFHPQIFCFKNFFDCSELLFLLHVTKQFFFF